MSNESTRSRSLDRLRSIRRQPVRLSGDTLVHRAPLLAGSDLPLVISPAVEGVDLVRWAAAQWQEVQELLLRHGAILFRGFDMRTPRQLEALVTATSGALLPYLFRSTPRSPVEGHVYTSTHYPANQTIPLHNELSYTSSWPRKLWFCCTQPSESGGETPLADSRAVLRAIDPAVREEFRTRGVMYTRNFGSTLGQTVREVFQTDDRAAVERYCQEHGIGYAWKAGDVLRTHQVRPALTLHPDTGEEVWFNQAHLFHITSLPPPVRETLLTTLAEEELPRNAYFGDGLPIPQAALEDVRAAYERNKVAFQWLKGDVLLVDNLLVAHGRMPFEGERTVIVAMSEPAGEVLEEPT